MTGSIVGANHRLGHRLRALSSEQPRQRKSVDVLIAGGGIAGLAAAWRLSHGGMEDYLLLELEDQLGGNSRAQRYGPSAAPWAAHYLPVPTRESTVVLRVLREMGLLTGFSAGGTPVYDEAELCHANEERVYELGRWEEGLFPRLGATSDDLAQWRKFEEHVQGWQRRRDRQGRKAFALPLEFSSPDWRWLDQLSMADYLTREGFTSPRLRWYVEYGCRDDYGTSLASTSAWAGLHYFASRDGGGYEPKDLQFVWPEGNHRLVRHLSRGLDVRGLCGRLVLRIGRQSTHWWVDAWNESEQRLEGYAARQVIYALPTFLRPFLLGEERRPQFTYCPWTVSNLVLDKLPESARADPVGLSWDNVIYGSPGLGYVVATHQSASHLHGGSVWTHYRPWSELEPAVARERMLKASWSEVCAEVLADLRVPHPDLKPVQLDVMQLGHAMIRPLPGFLWSDARRLAAVGHDELHFAHSDLSGLSVFEEASFHGVRAAQEILEKNGLLKEDFLKA